MENSLQVFESTEFGAVRMLEIDGKPYFVASDVATALGYSNPHKATGDHCPHLTKREVGVETGKKADGTPAVQNIAMNIIPEGDVYRLITHSKLPAAEKFEHWVFDEVLPTLRRTGSYTLAPAASVQKTDVSEIIRGLGNTRDALVDVFGARPEMALAVAMQLATDNQLTTS